MQRKFAGVVLFLALGLALSTSAMAEEGKFKLRVASAFPTKMPLVNNIQWFAQQIEAISHGSVKLELYEPGALVPPFEIQEAVSSGQVEAGSSSTVYMAGKMPAASLFTSVPFGPNVTAFFSWYYFGNGTKLLQEMYDTKGFNVKVWPMPFIPMETAGWFRKEINTVDDLKGLRLRWPGLAGRVLSKLGASISTIPGGEIFPALEKGAIDGTEFGNPILDASLGFWKVAKYNYFPGWHQPSTAMEFMINKNVWNKMSEGQKALMDMAIMAMTFRTIADSEAAVGRALKENAEKRGVKNLLLSKEILEALHKAWIEVAKEESDKDAFFKKVYDDLEMFMSDYRAWDRFSYSAMPREQK